MKGLVLLNEGAGTLAGMDAAQAAQRIARGFADAGADVEVRFVEPGKLAAVAEAATHSSLDVIIAGGGDGTLNSVANAVANAGAGQAFGVLPLGTHNHFAKDLKIPLDLDEAVATLSRAKVIDLPVGEVNGRMFLNFSAIGLHPEIVRDRETQRREEGRGKWTAMAVATVRKIANPQSQKLKLSARGHTFARRTPSVVICNNPHQMEAFGVKSASVPERGLLNVYVTTRAKRRTLISQLFRAAANQLNGRTPHFDAMALPDVRIDSNRRWVTVSIDGEVIDLRPPLYYRIRSRPLRVLAP